MHLTDRVAVTAPVDVNGHVIAVGIKPTANLERLAYLLVRWVGTLKLHLRSLVAHFHVKLKLVLAVEAEAVVDLVPVPGVAQHVIRPEFPDGADGAIVSGGHVLYS